MIIIQQKKRKKYHKSYISTLQEKINCAKRAESDPIHVLENNKIEEKLFNPACPTVSEFTTAFLKVRYHPLGAFL